VIAGILFASLVSSPLENDDGTIFNHRRNKRQCPLWVISRPPTLLVMETALHL